MSGSPAIARNVGSQSWCWTISLVTHARRHLAGPAHEQRNAERAFPVGVLLAAERRHRAVRPAVHVRPVVGAVHDERVVGDAELVEQVEQLADVLVVVDHRVVIRRLPAPRLAEALRLGVRPQVHVRGVHPAEERLAGRCCRLMKSPAAATNSSSHVSMRLRVSGPVSSIFCWPMRPQRGCSVGSSLSVAQQCSTPRGPKVGRELREGLRIRVVRDPRAPPRR